MMWTIIEKNPETNYSIITTYDNEKLALERFDNLTLPAKFKAALNYHEIWKVELRDPNDKRIKSRTRKRDNIA